MTDQKKSLKRNLLLLFVLLGFVLLVIWNTGGGGGAEGDAGSPAASLEVPIPNRFESIRQAVRKLRDAVFHQKNTAEEPAPAPPVSSVELAAWSAAFGAGRGKAPIDEETGGAGIAVQAGSEPQKNDHEPAAGFPGVILFKYNRQSDNAHFSAVLAPFGAEPIRIEGESAAEFCERLAAELDALSKSREAEFSRFYALETELAGPSQAEWLYENVKKRFSGILYESQSSVNE